MRFAIFFLIIILPIVEISLLIKLGGAIGAWATIFLIIGGAVFGLFLLRLQGLETLWRAKEQMLKGGSPLPQIMEGLLLLIAGISLIVPGLMTDIIGLFLLIPPLRRGIAGAMLGAHKAPQAQKSQGDKPPSNEIADEAIDVEFTIEEEERTGKKDE
ncbi:MAG: FxsA family protein [Parvibaculales bacterium]